ncbi:hypothetical protein GALL_67760 [mine drainage metagenome]|uniref:Uncharacterized protein n=1 Tax=mine drainage metagenome TaxID=410659 RepID=A0A1J5STW9_9ZZZZ
MNYSLTLALSPRERGLNLRFLKYSGFVDEVSHRGITITKCLLVSRR